MILRPYALIIDGRLETGLEVELIEGKIVDLRTISGRTEPYVLSPAFVNAHSHLEYRGLKGTMEETTFLPWIREIAAKKREQNLDEVRESCFLAAKENWETGVSIIAEHSDRPYASEALSHFGIIGPIFQELITLGAPNIAEKVAAVQNLARVNAGVVSPHATYTVHKEVLELLTLTPEILSIHVSESQAEFEFFVDHKGPFVEFFDKFGMPKPDKGQTPIQYLDSVGFLGRNRQLVHCCTATGPDIELVAERKAVVAHCPRSNKNLNCPEAPIREFLDAGVLVGLGLDSAASSGDIDMFLEMRAVSDNVTAEEVWRMATSMGAQSVGISGWDIAMGSTVDLIRLNIEGCECTEDLIDGCRPGMVERI